MEIVSYFFGFKVPTFLIKALISAVSIQNAKRNVLSSSSHAYQRSSLPAPREDFCCYDFFFSFIIAITLRVPAQLR